MHVGFPLQKPSMYEDPLKIKSTVFANIFLGYAGAVKFHPIFGSIIGTRANCFIDASQLDYAWP